MGYQFVEVARRLKGHSDERGLHPGRLALQALRVFINGELDQLQDFLDTSAPLLAPGARLALVTARRTEAALFKNFLRNHEDCHAFPLARCLSPRRLQELYPLLQTSKNFAVVQACQPLWPSSSEVGGKRFSVPWRRTSSSALLAAEMCLHATAFKATSARREPLPVVKT